MSEKANFFRDNKYYLIGGGLVLATAAGLAIRHFSSARELEEWNPISPPLPPAAPRPSTSWCLNRDYPLVYRTCHPDVFILQRALKALGADLGDTGPNRDGVDGKLGTLTLSALKSKFGRDSVSRADMDKLKAGMRKMGIAV